MAKIAEVEAGMKIRFEWAPKSLTRPAKFVVIDTTEVRFDNRDAGTDYYSVRGIATPEWGNGEYGPSRFARLVPANVEVEIV